MPKNSSPVFSSEKPAIDWEKRWGELVEVTGTRIAQGEKGAVRRDVPHYTEGRWEVIDVIDGMMPKGLTPFQGFLWGNAIKYMMRFMYKGTPDACLQKAATYTNWLRHSLEKEKT
jgi:hypothetical protein